MSEGEEHKNKKRVARILKGRERANSLSILDYIRIGDRESERENIKRKREENRELEEELNKRRNKCDRTPPGLKKMEMKNERGSEQESQKGDESMIGMLRELKEKMEGLRNEIKIINNNWELRMERMEQKIGNGRENEGARETE